MWSQMNTNMTSCLLTTHCIKLYQTHLLLIQLIYHILSYLIDDYSFSKIGNQMEIKPHSPNVKVAVNKT